MGHDMGTRRSAVSRQEPGGSPAQTLPGTCRGPALPTPPSQCLASGTVGMRLVLAEPPSWGHGRRP